MQHADKESSKILSLYRIYKSFESQNDSKKKNNNNKILLLSLKLHGKLFFWIEW